MKGHFIPRVLPAITVFICSAHFVTAQGGIANAQLNGVVTDPSGSAIPNAAISVRNTATNNVSSATSNDRGLYAVPNLAPGNYE